MSNPFKPKLIWLSPLDLIPYARNSKKHPPEQVAGIAKQIEKFGWDQPIVIDEDKEILKGHGRYLAALLLKLNTVPCVERKDLSKAEKKALRIGDNKVAESEWDLTNLEMDFTELLEEMNEESLSEMTGHSVKEINGIVSKWESDLKKVDNTKENLSGIRSMIRVNCPQEMKHDLKALIEQTIQDSGFEGVDIV